MSNSPSFGGTGPSSERVQGIFSQVAHGYDRANDWMTLGLARRWRREVVRWSGARPGDRILDCATGTGDLAIAFGRELGGEAVITATDFCPAMLERAPAKAAEAGLQIRFLEADTLQLPFDDHSFDVVSIAYGVRNVENPHRAVAEMARVCRPGGRVMILETGDNRGRPSAVLHWCFTQFALPLLGKLATGEREPYEYLRDSSRAFPSRGDFIEVMLEAYPFKAVHYRSFFLGSSFLYRGEVEGV